MKIHWINKVGQIACGQRIIKAQATSGQRGSTTDQTKATCKKCLTLLSRFTVSQ